MNSQHLFSLLEETARVRPDRVAYTGPGLRMTFSDLRRMASGVAARISGLLSPRQPVAVVCDARSAMCVPIFMGVLGAGCFYAPLDPALPAERLRLILELMRPAVIVSDEKRRDELSAMFPGLTVLPAEELTDTPENPALLTQRLAGILREDIATVLYTSGSTGIPKGVPHTHGSLLTWTENTVRKYGLTADTVLANQSPFYYANSLLELFVPMYLGAKVVMIPPSHLSFPARLIRYLREEGVTELCMTPSGFVAVANSGALTPGSLPDLGLFIMSGEIMPKAQLSVWMRAAPNAVAMNFYGSTEVLSVAAGRISDPDIEGILPSGTLFPDVRLRLLRDDGRPAAPGEPGEMWICGPTVAACYYRDPLRTRQSFGPDPLSEEDGLWFRTGDFATLDARGNLTVIGRKDSMIKHHGYRMELGEVEEALRRVPGCLEACCLIHPGRDELWCFVSGALTEAEITRCLRGSLAKYMMPERCVILDTLPHNANGKIDRALLRERLSAEV